MTPGMCHVMLCWSNSSSDCHCAYPSSKTDVGGCPLAVKQALSWHNSVAAEPLRAYMDRKPAQVPVAYSGCKRHSNHRCSPPVTTSLVTLHIPVIAAHGTPGFTVNWDLHYAVWYGFAQLSSPHANIKGWKALTPEKQESRVQVPKP